MSAIKARKVPLLLYGTAWKKDQTRQLVSQALQCGFTGIDTAAQPKHYQEHLVGEGIRDALSAGHLQRDDLYIQTKFTSIHGQNPQNMPYDAASSITDQVNASVGSSLQNLRCTEKIDEKAYLDCLVLHSPFPSMTQTKEAWRAMESHVPNAIRSLGISNTYHLNVLRELYDFATIKPSVIQNRFYQDSGYDRDIRLFCNDRGIVYQSFWTLTANPHLLRSELIELVAREASVSKPVALYGLVLGLGNVSVLNGTTNAERMREDLEGLQAIREWREANPQTSTEVQSAFETLLG
ncbi:related to aldo-keto reductase (AKR) [Ramularia collo-cygni]|uniref:Related to aldo-keto reductase (AKR) n=1 Tax=Ramularia collo-cygni TaxID=112498 RepID=A0A2D3ULH7_9PEZI|nr:related to aldo-keto reductase (AKR) [Ramularia collo-cygni]CZT14902.1 related to aldo-keto reductase (AKR) [Ramularia collo-cygni]